MWSAVSGLALAAGPVIGGALVGVWSWRGIFWFNLAFGLAALAAGLLVLPESADPDAHRVDTAGALVGVAALTAFTFAVIDGETLGFGAPTVILLLCVSALAAAAFFWRESRAAHPLLDLRFLRVPEFVAANMVAFCAYFATFAVFFFTALYLQEVVGYTGYQIALAFLPMTALMIAASLVAGRWTAAVGPKWSIFAGCLLFSAGLLLTTFSLSQKPGYARWPCRSPDRHRHRHDGGADHLVGAVGGAAGAVGHGGVGDQHQPGDRGRDRGGHPGRAGELPAAVQPHRQAQPPGHPVQLPGIVIHALETGAVPPAGTARARAAPRRPGMPRWSSR